jgi:hypothetical protein
VLTARARVKLGIVPDGCHFILDNSKEPTTSLNMHRWPISIRRTNDCDVISPNESWEILPSDVPVLVDFVWDFVRNKDYRIALIIQPGLPTILSCAIIARMFRRYNLMAVDGVVIYSTLPEYPVGTKHDL